MNKNRKKFLLWIIPILVVIFSVGGYVLYLASPDTQARNVVNEHLNSIMTGKGNPYETVDTMKVEKIFINVLAYKYLNTLKKDHIKNEPIVFDRTTYDAESKLHKQIGKQELNFLESYEKYINTFKKMYGDRANPKGDGFIVESEDYHYEFEFLYDVTLANRLGQRLYKKYVFEVKPLFTSQNKYAITGFHER